VLRLPAVERLLADSVAAAHLRRRRPGLLLTQHADHLLLGKAAFLHRPSPGDGLSYQPRDPQGSRSLPLTADGDARPRDYNQVRPHPADGDLTPQVALLRAGDRLPNPDQLCRSPLPSWRRRRDYQQPWTLTLSEELTGSRSGQMTWTGNSSL